MDLIIYTLQHTYFFMEVVVVILLIATFISKIYYKFNPPKYLLSEQEVKEHALILLNKESKINAIKYLRRNSAMSLKDAFEFINNYQKKETISNMSNEELYKLVQELVSQNQKIKAIKLVRKNTNLDLKASKEFVEKITPIKEIL